MPGKLNSYFLNNAAKTCSYGLKISEKLKSSMSFNLSVYNTQIENNRDLRRTNSKTNIHKQNIHNIPLQPARKTVIKIKWVQNKSFWTKYGYIQRCSHMEQPSQSFYGSNITTKINPRMDRVSMHLKRVSIYLHGIFVNVWMFCYLVLISLCVLGI